MESHPKLTSRTPKTFKVSGNSFWNQTKAESLSESQDHGTNWSNTSVALVVTRPVAEVHAESLDPLFCQLQARSRGLCFLYREDAPPFPYFRKVSNFSTLFLSAKNTYPGGASRQKSEKQNNARSSPFFNRPPNFHPKPHQQVDESKTPTLFYISNAAVFAITETFLASF